MASDNNNNNSNKLSRQNTMSADDNNMVVEKGGAGGGHNNVARVATAAAIATKFKRKNDVNNEMETKNSVTASSTTTPVTPAKDGSPPTKKAKTSGGSGAAVDTASPSKAGTVDLSTDDDNTTAGTYEVELPITPEGLLCNVQEAQSGHWYFAGYVRFDNGDTGPAEQQGLLRNVGDLILQVGEFVLLNRTMDEIQEIHSTVCQQGVPVKVKCLERKNGTPPAKQLQPPGVAKSKKTVNAKADKDQQPTNVAADASQGTGKDKGSAIKKKSKGSDKGMSKREDSKSAKETAKPPQPEWDSPKQLQENTEKSKANASLPPNVSEAISMDGISFRIGKNPDGSSCFLGYASIDEEERGRAFGTNKIISINGLSTAGMLFDQVVQTMRALREQKQQMTVRYVDLPKDDEEQQEQRPVTPEKTNPSSESAKKPIQNECTDAETESLKGASESASVKNPAQKETNETKQGSTSVIKDEAMDNEPYESADDTNGLDLSDEDEPEDEDLFEILYQVGRKKANQAQSRKAAQKLLSLLTGGSSGDESVWKEFESYGGINHMLTFLKRNVDHDPSVQLSLSIVALASKFGPEAAAQRFVQSNGVVIWSKAVGGLVDRIAANVDDDTPWPILGGLWSAMSQITDAIADSNDVSLTSDVKEKIADTAFMFIPDAARDFVKASPGRAMLIDILNCLSNLCCESNRGSLGHIRRYLAKKNLEQVLLALIESTDKGTVKDSPPGASLDQYKPIIDHSLYLMFSTLEGCDSNRLATVDFKQVLGFCFKAMSRFKECEDIQRHGFYSVQRALTIVSKGDGVKLGVVSNLAANILENEKLDGAEATKLKKEVAKFISTFTKKLS